METVAIIGTGRMGSLIARKISPNYNMVLVDKNLRQCGSLAKEVNGLATSEYSMLSCSNYIIVALPANVIPEILKEIKPFIAKEQILINISTDTEKSVFEPIKSLCKLASAKIIGHAQHMAATGELPLILIDGDDLDTCNKVAEIFSKIGCICYGDENIVKKVNNIASEEGIKAALNIKKRLEEINMPLEYLSFAIRNVACGTMNAYALGDMGSFAQKIIDKLKITERTDSC
ncbi:MAG: NAD(P)-binding domain-containing protein [Tepidanaerobacter acetatoxydans]|uniref:NAD(P)-binding domain-containing protein n=1 Tax=Tepidanaerobacter TaxID=499228 RepID=UPI000AC80968|nr:MULTISPECIES: NAD(P)-binding domain-containing protein [Tepidanaerobacter]NLU09856.1 NAD(P)-binding domain-containing protein [Tepidanaerobacter acetatoxydans]